MEEYKIKIEISGGEISPEVVPFLQKLGVKCTMIPTINIIDRNTIEYGYKITFYNVLPKEFKVKVWDQLQKNFQINCGYVQTQFYRGCIWNWPDIFRESNCPG